MEGALGDRGRALEEAFFAQKNRELLGNLIEELAEVETKSALAAMTGIQDPAVIDELFAAGISTDTLAAFSLVPLVAVAWADGSVALEEREAILKAAANEGIQTESNAGKLLQDWLVDTPPDDLLATWKDYASGVKASVSNKAQKRIAGDVLGRARAVAKAAGGILGIGSISESEEKVLEELSAVLS
ncbi:MAG TPA: hypothetical protein DCY79_07620 [Planctomycetaceae bacterium]|nr:hypothetical protein [Blastopirellula sp.]HAY79658.1 hypothetical protein [Planctomycetaceae bacterium]